MNPLVDKYLIDGCMRCKYGATPACKVNDWKDELVALRHIALASGLSEELKWGVPCYSWEGKNVAIVSAFKEYAALSFFKGVLLDDPQQLLSQQGESSQSARLIKFTSLAQIEALQDVLQAYLHAAIAHEKAGTKVVFAQQPEPIPEELLQQFQEDPALEAAFFALTPGRQRGYIIHFSQPKRSETRHARIEKCKAQILQGIGFHDAYKAGK